MRTIARSGLKMLRRAKADEVRDLRLKLAQLDVTLALMGGGMSATKRRALKQVEDTKERIQDLLLFESMTDEEVVDLMGRGGWSVA